MLCAAASMCQCGHDQCSWFSLRESAKCKDDGSQKISVESVEKLLLLTLDSLSDATGNMGIVLREAFQLWHGHTLWQDLFVFIATKKNIRIKQKQIKLWPSNLFALDAKAEYAADDILFVMIECHRKLSQTPASSAEDALLKRSILLSTCVSVAGMEALETSSAQKNVCRYLKECIIPNLRLLVDVKPGLGCLTSIADVQEVQEEWATSIVKLYDGMARVGMRTLLGRSAENKTYKYADYGISESRTRGSTSNVTVSHVWANEINDTVNSINALACLSQFIRKLETSLGGPTWTNDFVSTLCKFANVSKPPRVPADLLSYRELINRKEKDAIAEFLGFFASEDLSRAAMAYDPNSRTHLNTISRDEVYLHEFFNKSKMRKELLDPTPEIPYRPPTATQFTAEKRLVARVELSDATSLSQLFTSQERANAARKIQQCWRKSVLRMIFRMSVKKLKRRQMFGTGHVSRVSQNCETTISPEVNADATGPWTVLLSDDAQRALRRIARNTTVLKPILANITAVAEGRWLKSVAKELKRDNLKVRVYESKILSNLRVVWQVDVTYSEALRRYAQVIKVWSVTNHTGVVRTLDRLAIVQKSYSLEHIRRCGLRYRSPETSLMTPVVFDDDGGARARVLSIEEDSLVTFKEKDYLLLHDMAVTAKFVPLSKIFMNFILLRTAVDQNCDFPFALNEDEHDIVKHPGSVLLCGRSGTGKTTVCVFRLVSLYFAYHVRAVTPLYTAPKSMPFENGDDCTHLHQIFITASPIFCARVRSYFLRLVQAVSTVLGKEARNAVQADAFLKAIAAFREEFVSETKDSVRKSEQRRGMASYSPFSVDESDQSIIDYLLEQDCGGSDLKPVDEEGQPQLMLGEDEEEALMSSVPDSFLDLTDEHFPLFLTYRKFLSMMRNALGLSDEESLIDCDDTSKIDERALSGGQGGFDYEHEYARFAYRYWPHIDARLIKDIDVSLAFTEIMGIVKGSEMAARSLTGYLSLSQYENMSNRAYTAFKYSRKQLYDIFLTYRKLGGTDLMDRVNELNSVLPTKIHILPKVHEIFVDEVQDLTMSEILPLVMLGTRTNPNGLVFAGDTAQTIARGSCFRFQDLSSMIYRTLHSQMDEESVEKYKPQLFNLAKNYRSHNGILRVAASTLDLLEKYFPGAIDSMPRDVGVVDGPKPLCITGSSEDEFLGLFGLGVKSGVVGESEDNLEFGAEQVILVRDMNNERLLRDHIGDSALIMTVEEAKGMEFSDVLLFCPFDKAGSNWRVFLNEVTGYAGHLRAFDAVKHNILGTELKILYTAVTRARQRLIIFSRGNSEDGMNTMFMLWEQLGLIGHTKNVERLKEHEHYRALAIKSSPQQWGRQGLTLFERKQYRPALFCFQRELALNPSVGNKKALTCEASLYRQQGQILANQGKLKESADLHVKSAEIYVNLGNLRTAARLFEMAGRLESAATNFMEAGLPVDAARCLTKAENFIGAGQIYEDLGQPADAIKVYKQGNHFVEALRCSTKFPCITRKETRRLAQLGVVYYEFNSLNRLEAIRHLDDEEICTFFESREMFDDLINFHNERGQYIDAGRLSQKLGKLQQAGEYYEKALDLRSAARCYLDLLYESSAIKYLFENRLSEPDVSLSGDKCKYILDLLDRVDTLVETVKESENFKLNLGPYSLITHMGIESDCLRSLIIGDLTTARKCAISAIVFRTDDHISLRIALFATFLYARLYITKYKIPTPLTLSENDIQETLDILKSTMYFCQNIRNIETHENRTWWIEMLVGGSHSDYMPNMLNVTPSFLGLLLSEGQLTDSSGRFLYFPNALVKSFCDIFSSLSMEMVDRVQHICRWIVSRDMRLCLASKFSGDGTCQNTQCHALHISYEEDLRKLRSSICMHILDLLIHQRSFFHSNFQLRENWIRLFNPSTRFWQERIFRLLSGSSVTDQVECFKAIAIEDMVWRNSSSRLYVCI
ncbi:hypothetical protein BJ742DRAFT_364554 [Cladochytrium replicatum]|nr:hypothetical protein BJ742DRAFT_364554 [Cladochytrium replicatum]